MKANGKRTFAKRFFLACLATIGSLVVCEFLLRGFWHNPRASQSQELMMWLRVQARERDSFFDRHQVDLANPYVTFRTNSRSYIAPVEDDEPVEATIAFLGGSTTECGAVQEELRFPYYVRTLLRERGLHVATLNAARSGNTAHDSVNVLLNHVVFDHPDIVVMMHAYNDVGILSRFGDYDVLGAHPIGGRDLRTWFVQKCCSTSYLVSFTRRCLGGPTFRARDIQRLAWRNDPKESDGVPLEPFRLRLITFIHVCRSFNIIPVLVTQPVTGVTNELTPSIEGRGALDQFNATIRQVAVQENVALIDLIEFITKQPNWNKPGFFFYDGVHVNDRGSQAYGRHLADSIEPLVHTIASRENATEQ